MPPRHGPEADAAAFPPVSLSRPWCDYITGHFVDEGVAFDRQDDVGGFHRLLAGAVGPGDGKDDGAGPDAKPGGLGGEGTI